MDSKGVVEAVAVPAPRRVLGAADILDAQDLDRVELFVPEWKGVVILQAFTADEAAAMSANPKENDVATCAILAVVDEQGNRVFKAEDAPRLRKKSLRALVRIQEVVLEQNGLTQAAQEAVKKV